MTDQGEDLVRGEEEMGVVKEITVLDEGFEYVYLLSFPFSRLGGRRLRD